MNHRTIVRRSLFLALAVGGVAACGSASDTETSASTTAAQSILPVPCVGANVNVDIMRSLVLTDPRVLKSFSFESVMTRLVKVAGGPGQTPLEVYRQWWETQTASSATDKRLPNPRCDDELTNGVPSINGFPHQCPRAEGRLAATDPFTDGPDAMIPVALFNRFDLAPINGAHCGEYRIVFAKKSGLQFDDRNLVIFEGALTNPKPVAGLNACRPVADFWASLSNFRDIAAVAKAVHGFYFDGLPGFLPVVHPNHYGLGTATGGYGDPLAGAGRIRTNQFMNGIGTIWQLREFKLTQECAGGPPIGIDPVEPVPVLEATALRRPVPGPCRLVVRQVTDKNNPFGELFRAGTTEPRAPAFREGFLGSVASLAANNVNLIGMATADEFNSGESTAQGGDNHYGSIFGNQPTKFAARIQEQLTAIGSPLTPRNIVDRATTQSCAGCHDLSSGVNLNGPGMPVLRWPGSNGFTHVDEHGTLSPALLNEFLPARKVILETFLSGTTCRALPDAATAEANARAEGRSASQVTLSGHTTH